MKNSYNWEEIKSFLIKELKKTKHIMTFGTIGSCNVEKDIDTIITKKPKSKSSDFYKEIHDLFDKLDNYFRKKHNIGVIRFNQSVEDLYSQEIFDSKKIRFHALIYVCFPQLVNEWKWSLPKNQDILEILKKEYNCLLGSIKDLLDPDFNIEHNYSFIFTYIAMHDQVNFPLPKKLLLKISNHYFHYLYKKRLGLNAPVVRNKQEIKKAIYKLCDIVDELDNKKH